MNNKFLKTVFLFIVLSFDFCAFADLSGTEMIICESPDSIIEMDAYGDSLFCQERDAVTDLDRDYVPSYPAESRNTRFNAKALILPGALIVIGTFGVYNKTFREFDKNFKGEMDDLRGKCYFHLDDYIQYLPALTYLTFGSIGIKSKHSFKERLVVGISAYLAMAALTNVGKYTFREKRPDSNARNSFPSGHTATVFTGAELMREEYGPGIGMSAYALATGVAFLRLYNGRHWFNDVIAGAGIGILSARIGYWLLPVYSRWFKWDKKSDKALLMSPSYDPANYSFSINLVHIF